MPKNQQVNKKTHSVADGQPDKRRKQIRIAIIAIVLVVIIAGASVGAWVYNDNQNAPYREAAIQVNDVVFDMGYYVEMLKAYFGKVSAGDLYDFTAYGDIEVEQFAVYVQNEIIRNETIKQGSAALGVQIDRDAIETELKNSGKPVNDQQVDILMAERLIDKQVPVVQPQVNAEAILAANEEDARQAIARLKNGEPLEQVVKDLSKIAATKIANGELGWVTARQADLTVGSTKLGEALLAAETGVSSQPFYDDTVSKQYGYWVMKVTETKDITQSASDNTSDNTTVKSVHVKGLLLGSIQEAEDVIDKLNAGEDIDELAAKLSQTSTASVAGAELGWLVEGQESGDLKALFDLPVGGISRPIGDDQAQTKGGYWVFNILNKENARGLTASQQNTLQEDLIQRVTAELQKDPDYSVNVTLTQDMNTFAINEVVLAQGKGSVFINDKSVPDGEAGFPYSHQLGTYGEQKGNTWSITEGSLPKGLTLDTSTGLISGTPQFAGGSSFTLRVDNNYHYWEQEMFMRIRIAVSVATESFPDAQVGVDYSVHLEAMGDSSEYTWSLVSGTLPDGLSLGKLTGNIWGKPEKTGTWEFTLQVEDGLGSGTRTLTLTVVDAPPSDNTTAPSD